MGLFHRASLVMSANMNDLLDRCEQPEKMLRQGLRELEASIETVSAAVARSIAAERLLARERDNYQIQAETWHARAQAAAAGNDDSLARKALARKLELTRLIAALDVHLAEAQAANQTLRRQVETLRSKHAQAKRRLSTVAARKAVADAQQRVQLGTATLASRMRAVDSVDHLLDKLDWVEAEAAARSELVNQIDDELSDAFESAALSTAIEAELIELKKGSAG